MNGYTPNISTAHKIRNLAVQIGVGALLAAVDMSDGDAYEAERIMTGMALDKIATQGQDEGLAVADWFDDYKTPAPKDDAADLHNTNENARP